MSGSGWFVQRYPAVGGSPDEPTYFDDFATTLHYIRAFPNTAASDVILKVYTPAAATAEELRQLSDNGAKYV